MGSEPAGTDASHLPHAQPGLHHSEGPGASLGHLQSSEQDGAGVLLTADFQALLHEGPKSCHPSGRLSRSRRAIRVKQLLKPVSKCKLRSQPALLCPSPISNPAHTEQAVKGKTSQWKHCWSSSNTLLVLSSSTLFFSWHPQTTSETKIRMWSKARELLGTGTFTSSY